MAGDTHDGGGPGGARGHDVGERDVLQLARGRNFLPPPASPQAEEDGRANPDHGDVRHHDPLDAAPIHRRERDAGARIRPLAVGSRGDRAVAEHDVPEIAARLGAQLESVADVDERAVCHHQVFRRPAGSEGEARLGHDGIVPRLDATPGDPHIPTAVGIDPVRVPVPDGHPLDVHAVAAEKADVVVGGVVDGEVADPDLPAFLEGDGLRAAALAPVAVDAAGSQDADLAHAAPLEQGEAHVRGLAVRVRVVAGLFVPIEILIILARDHGGAGGEPKGDALSQVKGARHIVARGEVDGSARLGRGLDGRLDGARVLGLAVALGAIAAHVERGGLVRCPQGP